MVVWVRLISRNTSVGISERFRDKAAELRSRVAEKIADDIVDFSPVDTGTYIMAHVADTGPVTEDTLRSSHGKPRHRNRQQFQNLARGNLKRSVSKDAILNSAGIYFHNRAEHADHVEYMGWRGKAAYHVYGQARARVQQHISDAARELGVETR